MIRRDGLGIFRVSFLSDFFKWNPFDSDNDETVQEMLSTIMFSKLSTKFEKANNIENLEPNNFPNSKVSLFY